MIELLAEISKRYDVLSYLPDINSSNGICISNNKKFFYKILDKDNAKDEIEGYELAKHYVPCTQMQEKIDVDNYSILIYSYEESVRFNTGLLYDYFWDETVTLESFKMKFKAILESYTSTFGETVQDADSKSLKKFVFERLDDRLLGWYKDSMLSINVNGERITLSAVRKKLFCYMKSYKPSIYHLTHGDPSDMNITIVPVYLDYTTFGYNSLVLEFASFYWNLTFGGLYFFPKYHHHKYYLHQYPLPLLSVRRQYDKAGKCDEKLCFQMPKKRIAAIEQLIIAFKPFLQCTSEELIYFIVFRIMTIINMSQLEPSDQRFVITLIGKLWSCLNADTDVFLCLLELVKGGEDNV